MRRAVLGSALLLLATGALTAGCSTGGDSARDDAADRVAAQLASGKLTASAFSDADTAQQKYDQLVGGLRAVHPTVEVAGTKGSDTSATAKLAWSWPVVAGHPWRYTTTVRLAPHGDDWTATWDPAYVVPDAEPGDRLVLHRVAAPRGKILGAGGAPLVKDRPVIRFGIDKAQVAGARATSSARALARLVDVDVASYLKQVKAAGAKAFVVALTLREGAVPPAVQQGYTRIAGAYAQHGTLPLAPTKEFAAPLLGSVGQATAEIVKASDGRVRPGDEVGLSGMQRRYDEQLAGTPGTSVVLERGTDAKAVPELTVPPVPGKPLRLTLAPRSQRLAESALAGVGPASALVAIRPSTGEVLAAASGPGSKGYNTATYGRYAPGSTFKIVSSLALLRTGLTPASTVHCTPTVTVDGKRFKNYSDYPSARLGDISLTDAVANSCNTAFVSSHSRLSGDDLGQAAAALGFGVDHDTGFPSFFGQAPEPAGETEAAADLIGQGKILASPMAMATVVASVVAGKAVVPELVQGQQATADPDHPLTAKEASALRAMLRAVVTRGSGAALADLPGPPVIAKTGTAEFGEAPQPPTHAWMVAGQGDLAVAVFVDRGDSGSGTAGPILERFLRQQR